MDSRGLGRIRYNTETLKPRRLDVRAVRRAAILREIGDRSGDPELSAIAVARLLGITPRYVHLLLEDTGRRFSRHLLEKRLEKAAVLLRDSGWSDRRIIDIAAEAGFANLSYFNRAFRKQYGARPSDVRNATFKERR